MVCVLQSKLPRSTAVFSFIASRFSFHKTFLILAPFFSVYHNSNCISYIYLLVPYPSNLEGELMARRCSPKIPRQNRMDRFE